MTSEFFLEDVGGKVSYSRGVLGYGSILTSPRIIMGIKAPRGSIFLFEPPTYLNQGGEKTSTQVEAIRYFMEQHREDR